MTNWRPSQIRASGEDESRPGRPPVVPATGGSQPDRDRRPLRRGLRGVRTLIVEDDPIDQKLAMAAAQNLALRAEVVANGADAIERLQAADGDDRFDLVVIDYRLPNLDGLTASRHIKSKLNLAHPPKIILLSAYTRDEVLTGNADRHYIDAFLTKPLLPTYFSEALARLQADAIAAGEAWPNAGRHDEAILAKTHVLLAEDNEINQRVAIGMLERRGVSVTLANNGREALEMVFAMPPDTFDLILMDVDMPFIDGYEATRAIKGHNDYAHLPIIALTAHNSKRDRERCIEAGMAEYLTKPIKPNFLYDTLLRFLR